MWIWKPRGKDFQSQLGISAAYILLKMKILGCCLKNTQTTKESVLSSGISPLFRVAKLHRVVLAQVLLMLYRSPCTCNSLETCLLIFGDDQLSSGKRSGRKWAGIWETSHTLIHSAVKQSSGKWGGLDMWNFWDSPSQYSSQEVLAKLALQFIWELQKGWMQ